MNLNPSGFSKFTMSNPWEEVTLTKLDPWRAATEIFVVDDGQIVDAGGFEEVRTRSNYSSGSFFI